MKQMQLLNYLKVLQTIKQQWNNLKISNKKVMIINNRSNKQKKYTNTKLNGKILHIESQESTTN